MRYSIRNRILAMLIGMVIFAVLLCSAVWVYGLNQIRREAGLISVDTIRVHGHAEISASSESLAQLLAEQLVNPVYFYDLAAIGKLIDPVVNRSVVAYVTVFDDQGRIIHDGERSLPSFGQPMRDDLAETAMASAVMQTRWYDDVVETTVPLFVGERRLGGVRVGLSAAEIESNVSEAVEEIRGGFSDILANRSQWMMLVLLAVSAVGVLVTVFLTRNLFQPMADLNRYAALIADGHYDLDIQSDRKDEFGGLLRAFGKMSESVRRNSLAVRHLAYHDSLTGLPNRLMFHEYLKHRLAWAGKNKARVALIYLDLDDFKKINDSLGHYAGDQVLVEFAKRLRQQVLADGNRQETQGIVSKMIARLGGDEFTVTLAGQGVDTAAEVLMNRILACLHTPFEVDGQEMHIGASLGLTLYPEDALDSDMMVKNADLAMYQAKLAGKNRIQRFYSKLTTDADQQMQLETNLRTAVENESFEVHYQPFLNLASMEVVGAEALIRWNDAELGLVSPSIFIPVAEQAGLVEEIGLQVLRQALLDAKQWAEVCGREYTISVNLSSRQIAEGQQYFLSELRKLLEETQFPPHYLMLELSENCMPNQHDEVVRLVAEARKLGVRVMLDDFGTGFAGLSQLRSLPVDGVKIDRSFIHDILIDPDDLALTSAILSMAQSLNMIVVAEGVEHEGQVRLLLERACRYGQGYLLGPPMDHQSFLDRIVHGAETIDQL